MNNIVMAISGLPSIDEFMNNPIQGISSVLTTPFGVIGYIFILFAIVAITYSYTRNFESVGIIIVLFGALASVLYPIQVTLMMLFLGVGVIFGSTLWKAVFKSRGDY